MTKRKPNPTQLDPFAWAAARPSAKHVARTSYAAAEQTPAHRADADVVHQRGPTDAA